VNEDEVATDEDESPTTPAWPRQRTTRRELVEDPVPSSVIEEEDFVTSPRAPSYRVVSGSVRRRNLEDHSVFPAVEEEDLVTNLRARVPSYRTVSTEQMHLTYRN
jgi:hypothetical protein